MTVKGRTTAFIHRKTLFYLHKRVYDRYGICFMNSGTDGGFTKK